ncbi:MAG: FkbM family methyltransferase [Prolixibacteraceae bacterium]
MRIIEKLKLRQRAYKYKNKNDIGGIDFLISTLKKGDAVLDIGAHKAGYLYWMQKITGNEGKIFAFEPQSVLFDYLTYIKEIFHWNNVTVEHLALSDNAGETTLYIPLNKIRKKSSPEATILNIQNKKTVVKKEKIKTDTLDSYCSKMNIKPAFIKIDVEGNELNVFHGGKNIITKYKPKILVEIEARHAGKDKVLKTFEFLKNLGYHGFFLHHSGRIPLVNFNFEVYQNKSDMENYCNNFIFEACYNKTK